MTQKERIIELERKVEQQGKDLLSASELILKITEWIEKQYKDVELKETDSEGIVVNSLEDFERFLRGDKITPKVEYFVENNTTPLIDQI